MTITWMKLGGNPPPGNNSLQRFRYHLDVCSALIGVSFPWVITIIPLNKNLHSTTNDDIIIAYPMKIIHIKHQYL